MTAHLPCRDLDLAIPAFLRRAPEPGSRPPPQPSARARPWRLPPRALAPVARAVRRGHDTMGKLRGALGRRFTDAEIRAAIRTLAETGVVVVDGRRYRPAR